MTMPMPTTLAARAPAPVCGGGAIWSMAKSTSWWEDNLEPDWGIITVQDSWTGRGVLPVCSDAEEAGRVAACERAYEAHEAARRAEAVQADGFTIAADEGAAVDAVAMTAAEIGRAVRALRTLFAKEGASAAVAALAALVGGSLRLMEDGPAGAYRAVHQDRGSTVLLTANKWPLVRVDGEGLRVFAVRRPPGPTPEEAATAAAARRALTAVKATLRAPRARAEGGGWILHPEESRRLALMGVNYHPGQEGGYLSWDYGKTGREGTVGVGRHLARLAEQAGGAEQEAAAWGFDGW